MALPAYRSLLRAIRTAFQGDSTLLSAARTQSRTAFASSRDLPADSPDAHDRIQHARDVAKILRENVVQGKIESREGSAGQGGSAEGEGGVYRLRIHPEIERGDNDTIKNPKTGVTSPRVKCCSEK